MPKVARAEYDLGGRPRHVKDVIRLVVGGSDTTPRTYRLTLAKARQLQQSLTQAIREAEANESLPDPPIANAAALPAA